VATGLALLAKTVWLAVLPELGSAVRQVQGNAQDFHGELIHIHAVHVTQHYNPCTPTGNDGERGAGALLAAGVRQNGQAKLVRDAPTQTVSRLLSLCRL
jgi:hypothetical protein